MDVASIHLVGRAETWFSSYIAVRRNVDWSDFIVDVCNRFREEMGSRIVEDFHKLQQLGSVEAYLEKFEELKCLLLQNMPMLPDDYFVSSFIGGLKPHLKPFVKALNPSTLDDAVRFARLHEDAGDTVKYNQKSSLAKPPLLALPRASSGFGGTRDQSTYFPATKPGGSGMSSSGSSGGSNTQTTA